MLVNDYHRISRKPTRTVVAGQVKIGSAHPIVIQSMCATKTQNIEATVEQIRLLKEHGAGLVRIAIDSKRDVEALAEIRKKTDAALVVDLQESYRLASLVAPYVQKIRYNPGHLHHHEKSVPVTEKVKFIVETAKRHNCALRIGVNFGSLDPDKEAEGSVPLEVALASAKEHVSLLEECEFSNFVVSLKSSDPNDVIEINRRFSDECPNVPIHLGVTEAGLLPIGPARL